MSSPFWDEWFKRMRERRGFFFCTRVIHFHITIPIDTVKPNRM